MSTKQNEKDTVSFTIENRIAWVKYNRPDKRNAQSPSLNRRMFEVIDELEFRDDVGLLVLTGEGDAWCAGMDLKEYFRETEALGLAGTRKAQSEAYRWWRRLRWYQKPHHRHGQWLVLWRRVRPAVRLRPGYRRG